MKQLRIDDPKKAADRLALAILDQPARLIRIDGQSMAGKTSLAKQLSRLLAGIHIDTDAYFVSGELQQSQLLENLAQYVASGLYVIVEGIRLEERCPSAGPAFRVLMTSEYEDQQDAARPTEINAELGVDRYFEQYRPSDQTDIEVIVRHASEHAAIIAAIEKMNAGNEGDDDQ